MTRPGKEAVSPQLREVWSGPRCYSDYHQCYYYYSHILLLLLLPSSHGHGHGTEYTQWGQVERRRRRVVRRIVDSLSRVVRPVVSHCRGRNYDSIVALHPIDFLEPCCDYEMYASGRNRECLPVEFDDEGVSAGLDPGQKRDFPSTVDFSAFAGCV